MECGKVPSLDTARPLHHEHTETVASCLEPRNQRKKMKEKERHRGQRGLTRQKEGMGGKEMRGGAIGMGVIPEQCIKAWQFKNMN